MQADITERLQETVAAAFERRAPLLIRGGGSKQFLGRECVGELLDVGGHAGIVRHEPTELMMTVRAGTPLSVAFLARMANEIDNLSYFKIEVPQAANKLRALIEAGGEAIEGPWDGEEAITLLADLDAGATGAMTGGGYPDGIRKIIDPYVAGDRDAAVDAYMRWLPLINYENRQSSFATAKILMKEGGIIGSDRLRAPLPPVHPATRAGLLEIAWRLDPLVLNWNH